MSADHRHGRDGDDREREHRSDASALAGAPEAVERGPADGHDILVRRVTHRRVLPHDS
jgi:hypothetical protein